MAEKVIPSDDESQSGPEGTGKADEKARGKNTSSKIEEEKEPGKKAPSKTR